MTGVGQVIFLNSDTAGKILLASLAVGDPFLAIMAALGTATSSATAHCANLDASTTSNGLYSYNGCLVGCAASVFATTTTAATMTTSSLLSIVAFTVAGSASATFVTAALTKKVVTTAPAMPQWTFAFNIVALTTLLRVQPLLAPSSAAAVITSASSSSSSLEGAASAAVAILGTAAAAAAADPLLSTTTTTTAALGTLLLSPLTGLSQIFVVESAWTGAGIVAAIASYSPALAAHAVAGSVTGSLVGAFCLGGAAAADIGAGLWGFNSALTSLGVAVFFVPTKQSAVLSIGGAAATAAVFGALQPVFSTVLKCPCLTLPFCLTMSACWALGSTSSSARQPLVPGLVLASNPHSPEKNGVTNNTGTIV